MRKVEWALWPLSDEKSVLNVQSRDAGRAGGAPGKFRQKLAFIGGAKEGNTPIRGKQREEVHLDTLVVCLRRRSVSVRRAQPIADPCLSQDVVGPFRIGFDLLPQLTDVDS